MARTDNLTNYLTDVASAIKTRSNLDQSTKISAKDFDSWIIDIPDSGNNPFESLGWDHYPKHLEHDIEWSMDNSVESIVNNWDPSNTDASSLFESTTVKYAPYLDTSNVTNMTCMCSEDPVSYLIEIPLYNTSNVTNMSYMFSYAEDLRYVPVLDTRKVTNMDGMFQGVLGNRDSDKLDDNFLNNILIMCTNAISYNGIKKLTTLGIKTDTSLTEERIQQLPAYQDFVNAGWSIK